MEKQTAEAFAKKGYAIIKSAAKSGVAAISQGVASVRKGYATKHEADVLSQLKSQGLHPAEHLHAGFPHLLQWSRFCKSCFPGCFLYFLPSVGFHYTHLE